MNRKFCRYWSLPSTAIRNLRISNIIAYLQNMLFFLSEFFSFYNRCVKGVRIRSYSGLYFPAFGLNTKRYGVSLRIQSKCRKIQTRTTLNTNTFQEVNFTLKNINILLYIIVLGASFKFSSQIFHGGPASCLN